MKVLSKILKGSFNRSIFLLVAIVVLCSHDLYLKMELYFLQPNQEATLSLYNGTFEKSENTITRDRMLDASFVAQGKRIAIDSALWKDQDSTITQLTFNTGEAGTYVAGVSTKARNIELTADNFNDYLKHDGILDMLEKRKKNNTLDKDAVESYQKHVKAIYQVGTTKTDDWKTVLGYPIEFVPLTNPYDKYSGESLELQLLLDGKPLANQLVYADHVDTNYSLTGDDHDHDHDHSHDDHDHGDHNHGDDHKHDDHSHDDHDHNHEGHDHDDHEGHDHEGHDHEGHDHDDHSHGGKELRTNEQGIVSIKLPHDAIYYIRTIHMVNVTNSDKVTHESKWATLTFEVTHKHGNGGHDHDHDDHDEEEGIPMWAFILGSVLFIGVLFFVFRKKS